MSQKKIEIVHAGSLKFDKHLGNGAKRLIGDVQFKQENSLMFCDSAYFYSDNSLDAFSKIHIQQGDSVHLYGDVLHYSGNTKKAIITGNVIMIKGELKLTTDVLNYDMAENTGYYTTTAKITDKENELTSTTGFYFSKTNELNFKNNVVLTNKEFVIKSDTMRYNTTSKTTYFAGPTTITGNNNLIYCEDGWYNTFTNLSRFSKHAYLKTKEQTMFGDSLYYDRKNGIGKAVKNVEITDTTQNITITGNLALHYEFTKTSIVTGNGLLKQKFENDTLFLHADTLKSVGENSKNVDAKEVQNLFAFHKVKFYKKDLQGKCDSLYYSLSDSTMKMFFEPTLWSADNQLTADSIRLVTGKQSVKSILMKGNGFIVSQEDSLHFNQIRGKEMTGYFKENKLYLLHVEGNGQTIYYVKDKEKENESSRIKAVNRADCSDLNIYIKENKIEKINFITKPDATIYPLNQVQINELKLKGFVWRMKDRPLNFKEIFIE